MRWPDAVTDSVQRAIDDSTAGIPTVLDISGGPGFGKSTLARWVARQFRPEQVLRATGYEADEADTLGIALQLDPDLSDDDTNALRIARRLGRRLDQLQVTGAAVIVLDDIQWADPESIDAIGILLDRMAGDRLLVVGTHRPTGASSARWAAHIEAAPSMIRVVLDGIDDQSALEIVRESNPTANAALAAHLSRHTGGNPLFLRSLTHEYPAAVLAEMADAGRLPAPSDLARALGERLSVLDRDAVAALDALAVLGDSGGDIFVVGAVADVDDVDRALAILRTEGLIVVDGARPVRARVFHGVIRAAVYEAMPTPTRQRMHARAAARLASPRERLDHRVAAARTADEGLASDLDAFADDLHAQRRFRRAAKVRRQAATLSADVQTRVRRERDADFEAILAFDVEGLTTDAGPSEDLDPRGRLTLGFRRIAEGRYVEAAELLQWLSNDQLEELGPLAAYRTRVLRGWAIVSAGLSPSLAFADLTIAAASAVKDPALEGFFSIAYGQAAIIAAPPSERRSLGDLLSVNRGQLTTTPGGLTQLAWRGAAMALNGVQRVAIGDLEIVIQRLGDGIVDFGDGAFFALQGFAYFFDGQWGRAAISFELARTERSSTAAPLTSALLPVATLISGDERGTRDALREARRIRVRSPQPAAVHAGDIVEVVTLILFGSAHEREGWVDRRSLDFGEADPEREGGPLAWLIAHAIAETWAGRRAAVGRWTDAIRATYSSSVSWAGYVAEWLDARTQDPTSFHDRTEQILHAGLADSPLLEALIQLDVAQRMDGSDKHVARSRVIRTLIGFGGERLAATLYPDEEKIEHGGEAESTMLSLLSDREREIATLLVEGLSYAQIGQELFITRSTVSFHLTRIYAKTRTNSRHDFAQAYAASRAPQNPTQTSQ